MRAAWYTDFGTASDVLTTGDLPEPAPGPGEVLIRVEASGVNPVDVKRRTGGRGAMTSARVVPHFDGAGVVEGSGDGADKFSKGDRVWFYEAQWNRDAGSAAQRIALPEALVARLPSDASFAFGASLGIPALTAHRCVFRDGPVEGQTVLVTGGAGAVGHYAVQFAHLAGAEVIATVSSEEKAALAKRCGAATVLNYKTEEVAERVMELTSSQGADRIVEVELGGNLETCIAAVKPNGVVAAYASDAVKEPTLPFYQILYKNVTIRAELVFLMPDEAKRAAVDDIGRWLSDGALHHSPGPTFSLDDIVAAHEAVEAGTIGKVVVNP